MAEVVKMEATNKRVIVSFDKSVHPYKTPSEDIFGGNVLAGVGLQLGAEQRRRDVVP